MKVLTANRLSDGKVIYADTSGWPVDGLDEAGRFDDETGAAMLVRVLRAPDTFVNPYLIEANEEGPSGRDRLKETIRASGPTVGHSVGIA